MSQNSLVLPTSGTLTGLAAVQAINAALDTLNTLNSGASAPSSPEAGQFWHDTGNNILKLRSQDNTAWIAIATLDETNHVANAAVKAQPSIFGLTLSRDTSSPTTVLDIAAGGAFDSTASTYMRLSAATKKNVTSAWTAGSGNGSLDTGSWASSSWYHVHLIFNATTGAVDVLTSLSFSNPSLPSGYGYFVPIGAIQSNASSQILPFVQTGNQFNYVTPSNDLTTPLAAQSKVLATLSVPGGVKVQALLRVGLSIVAPSAPYYQSVLVTSPDSSGDTIGPANSTLEVASFTAGYTITGSEETIVVTNASSQVLLSASGSLTNSDIFLYTRGFIYPRGLQ